MITDNSLIKTAILDDKTLFEKAQNGDIECRNILLEKNLGLCHQIAHEFSASFEHNEAVNICVLSMIRAIETYNSTAKFSTYACVIMRRKLIEILRTNKKYEKESSLQTMLGDRTDDNKLQYERILDSGESVEGNLFKKCILHYTKLAIDIAKETSSDRDFKAFVRFYGLDGKEPKSATQIARELHLSLAAVKQIMYNMRGKIRKRFKKMGLTAENVL